MILLSVMRLKQCRAMGQQCRAFLSSFSVSWTSQRFLGAKDRARAKAAPTQGSAGGAMLRHLPCFLPTMKTLGGCGHPHCASQHTLYSNEGEKLTFGTTAQAETPPSWQSPEQQDPSPGSCLPPATLLSPMPAPRSTETKPHARDTPCLSSLTPNRALFPSFATTSNYSNMVWHRQSVAFMIKVSFG